MPNALVILYFGLIASPQYVSRSSLIVYQANNSATESSISSKLNLDAGGIPLEGDYLVSAYIRSWSGFRQQNQSAMARAWGHGDFVSRFGGALDLWRSNPTLLWHYYLRHVDVSINKDSALMDVRVQSYDPRSATQLNAAVLDAAAVAVNRIDAAAVRSAERFFTGRVQQAKAELRNDIAGLTKLQIHTGVIDFGEAYKSKLALLDALAEKKAALDAKLAVVTGSEPQNPQADALRTAIASVQSRIDVITGTLRGRAGVFGAHVGKYDYQVALITNAETALKVDEMQLLSAQQSALRRRYTIGYIEAPAVTTQPTRPRRLFWIAVVLIVTFLFYVIFKPSSQQVSPKPRAKGHREASQA